MMFLNGYAVRNLAFSGGICPVLKGSNSSCKVVEVEVEVDDAVLAQALIK